MPFAQEPNGVWISALILGHSCLRQQVRPPWSEILVAHLTRLVAVYLDCPSRTRKEALWGRSAAMTSRLVCLLRRDDRPLANVITYPFPEGGYVMRTLLIV